MKGIEIIKESRVFVVLKGLKLTTNQCVEGKR
jgi:hypothetical protein